MIWRLALCLTVALGLVGCGEESAASADAGLDRDEMDRDDLNLDPDADRRESFLRELGYLDWVEADPADGMGVVHHEPDRVWPGYNLFAPQGQNAAFLIDMEGELVHRWRAPELIGEWQHARLLPNGDVLAVSKERHASRLDLDSNVVWSVPMRSHHDLNETLDGDVIVIGRELREVALGDGPELPIVDDYFARIRPDGEVVERIWVSDLFGHLVSEERKSLIDDETGWWWSLTGRDELESMDCFHTNSIEIVDRDIPGVCARGDILTSIREINTVAFVDLETREIKWTWGAGELSRQHHPTLTADDTVLIFDNRADGRVYSRIVEVDPRTDEIVWEYVADPPESFRARRRGGSQKLPNGNVIVTHSSRGRVFELTREGEIVWQYLNPFMKDEGTQRASIFRMIRIDSDTWDRLGTGD